MSNLANGVSIRITVSFTLSVETMETTVASVGSIARDAAMSVVNSSDDTIGVSMSNLTNGVGIRITVSFTLSVETMETTVASVASIASVATVANGSVTRDMAIAV